MNFPASNDFCCLLITFANSLDPDQARQNIGPDLDPNCLTLWWYSWKIFFKKDNLKKQNPQTTKKHAKLPSMQRDKQVRILFYLSRILQLEKKKWCLFSDILKKIFNLILCCALHTFILKALITTLEADTLKYFILFSEKIRLGISCESST